MFRISIYKPLGTENTLFYNNIVTLHWRFFWNIDGISFRSFWKIWFKCVVYIYLLIKYQGLILPQKVFISVFLDSFELNCFTSLKWFTFLLNKTRKGANISLFYKAGQRSARLTTTLDRATLVWNSLTSPGRSTNGRSRC